MDPLFGCDSLVNDLAETFAAEQSLVERLGRVRGGPIRVCLPATADIEGTLLRVGRDHLWVADSSGFWIVAIAHVDAVFGWQDLRPSAGGLTPMRQISLPGLGSGLREVLSSDRSVSVLAGGRWIAGKPTFVGRDFLEADGVIIPFQRIRVCRVWY